jgi:hypothetical protein
MTSHDADNASGPAIDWSDRFPKLFGLFGNHLVESWTSVHETAADALREGIDDRTVDDLHAALREIRDLLALGLSEEALEDLLFYGLGSYYRVTGQTNAEWLEEVATQIREAVAARSGNRSVS